LLSPLPRRRYNGYLRNVERHLQKHIASHCIRSQPCLLPTVNSSRFVSHYVTHNWFCTGSIFNISHKCILHYRRLTSWYFIVETSSFSVRSELSLKQNLPAYIQAKYALSPLPSLKINDCLNTLYISSKLFD
jgi:hypothetical protein